MTDVEVAVIGGGISGLAVADELARDGRTVRLFEARSQLGGRIRTIPVPGGHADLGPTWFWPGEERVARLAAALGLAVHEQWATGDALLAADGTIRRVGGFAPPRSYRFSDGALGLVNGLAARLPDDTVELGSPVSRVERLADRLIVHTSDGDSTARSVVVALPPSLAISLGVIHPGDLDPIVLRAAEQVAVWMGAVTKAVAVYPDPFWREAGLSGLVSAANGPFHEIHDMSGPDGSPAMLFGFGQSRPDHPPLTAEVFVDQLTTLFGTGAASPIRTCAVDWRQERFTTPQTWPPSVRYELFGSPPLQAPAWDGRLHWTSTETATVAPGHLEGALAAAARTAGTIIGP